MDARSPKIRLPMKYSSPIGRRPTIAAYIAAALLGCLAPVVAAQELALPAVDDSPSSQLLIEQATDQAKANPREAVRLLVQVLDAGPDRLVRAGLDADVFVPVSRRVHAMLVADRHCGALSGANFPLMPTRNWHAVNMLNLRPAVSTPRQAWRHRSVWLRHA